MDRAYTLAQAEIWHRMSEAAQHAWMRREWPNHASKCPKCKEHGYG